MPRIVADLSKITEAEWLALRLRGIGSSDAPAVVGVSPWKSAFQLYAEKLGLAESQEENEAMRWGKLLEPVVAAEYARETGRTVEHPRVLLQHDTRDFMLATPDRFALTERGRIVVEIKTASAYKADEWAEEPPIAYQVQVQHLLAVTGFPVGSLVVLLGGQRLVWADLERNEKFIALLFEREQEFWDRVQRLDPPPPDATANALLGQVYPRDDGESVALPPEALEWDKARAEAIAQMKHWEQVRDEAEARLKGTIKDAAYGVLPGGGRYSWKLQTQERPAQEARTVEFRALRRLKT